MNTFGKKWREITAVAALALAALPAAAETNYYYEISGSGAPVLLADVKKLTMPTMLVFGDGDMYRPEHVVEFCKLLGGGLRDAGWGRSTARPDRGS